MKGIVVKKLPTLFVVKCEKGEFSCQGRGLLKGKGIFVGDKVEFDENNLIIEKILPRKNCIIRPPLANLDKMFIVICAIPKPDLYLVDKLLLFCKLNGIEGIICVNKTDEDIAVAQKIKEIYGKYYKVLTCSAKANNTSEITQEIKGICAFAGQSAVGKSSLINSIFGKDFEEIGELGKRVERGKQTTRLVTLYPFEDSFIADTAGFSQLDEALLSIDERELSRYYPDFFPFINECKYSSCEHKSGSDCAVIKAVRDGKIARERYENYLKLLAAKKSERKY